jgi:hypothetical protein
LSELTKPNLSKNLLKTAKNCEKLPKVSFLSKSGKN